MTKEQIKTFALEKLQSKRIILFGAGKDAKEFYLEHKERLNISHCVSNYEKEWGEGAFLGELDIRQYKKEDLQANDYLVVCVQYTLMTIELQLEVDGLKMYEHFIESKIASAILYKKQIALFYGECILRDICQCIVQVPVFSAVYASIFTLVRRQQAVITNRLLYYAKDICDLYVYTPKILDRDSVFAVSRDELPEDCKVVSISNLVMSLYWPQISPQLSEMNEMYLYPYNIYRGDIWGHTLYRRKDCNINKMVLQGLSTTEIVDTLSAEDFYSEKQILKRKDIFFKSVDLAEKSVDITIADYIRDNYVTIPLYQNFIHCNKYIIWEYVRRLLCKLGLATAGLKDLEEKLPDPAHQGGDVPIYPSVIKHLKLDFVNMQTRYEIIVGNKIVYMTFREYMEHFTEYTRKASEIISMQ